MGCFGVRFLVVFLGFEGWFWCFSWFFGGVRFFGGFGGNFGSFLGEVF